MSVVELLRSPDALPAAFLCALILAYFLAISASVVGRLRLQHSPGAAPLVTDDGPAIGDRVAPEVLRRMAGAEAGRDRLAVIFAGPFCAPCLELLPHLSAAAARRLVQGWVLVEMLSSITL